MCSFVFDLRALCEGVKENELVPYKGVNSAALCLQSVYANVFCYPAVNAAKAVHNWPVWTNVAGIFFFSFATAYTVLCLVI